VLSATERRAPSRSVRALSLRDKVSRIRFCVAKPANSGMLKFRPTVVVVVFELEVVVKVPLGLRVPP